MLARFHPTTVLTTLFALFLSLTSYNYNWFAHSAMTPVDLENSMNALAQSAFALKDLINAIAASKNPGALQDVFEEFDDVFDGVMADIAIIPGTAVLSETGNDQQLVFEAYSNVSRILGSGRWVVGQLACRVMDANIFWM
jgi:hypothetical protein